MDEVVNLQVHAMNLLEEWGKWRYKLDDPEEVHRVLSGRGKYREILDCFDLRDLSLTADQIQEDIDAYMMQKLSENL
jgi:hypothetical protein